ncbi:MAG TPA: hypothetical protein VGH79_09320 [Gaiellaceae bacterium]|jgi:hypothetical protein
MGALAAARSESGVDFTARGIGDLFHELGLPAPSRVDNALAALERRGFVRRGKSRGLWRVSPVGRQTASGIIGEVDLTALAAEAAARGTHLGAAPHPVISPSFAPPALVEPLRRFLADHPFDKNVMGMTRFPETADDDPVAPALRVARDVCAQHGLEFHLASDRAMDDDLWTNVAAHMWASRYGIAFFEDRVDRGMNYNLTIEVGSMLMTGRRCALLKDKSVERLPTDLVGRIRKDVDLDELPSVRDALHRWIRDDLDLGACPNCPS